MDIINFLIPYSQSVIDRIRSEVFLPEDQLLEQTHVLGIKTTLVLNEKNLQISLKMVQYFPMSTQ